MVDIDAIVTDTRACNPLRWAVTSCCSVDTRALQPTLSVTESAGAQTLRSAHWGTSKVAIIGLGKTCQAGLAVTQSNAPPAQLPRTRPGEADSA